MNLPAQFSIIQKAEDAEDGRINLLAAVDEEVKVDMGLPTDESGAAAIKALDRAMTDYRNNLYDVLITAPVSSQNVKIEGYTFKGHKEYIETCIGDRNSYHRKDTFGSSSWCNQSGKYREQDNIALADIEARFPHHQSTHRRTRPES